MSVPAYPQKQHKRVRSLSNTVTNLSAGEPGTVEDLSSKELAPQQMSQLLTSTVTEPTSGGLHYPHLMQNRHSYHSTMSRRISESLLSSPIPEASDGMEGWTYPSGDGARKESPHHSATASPHGSLTSTPAPTSRSIPPEANDMTPLFKDSWSRTQGTEGLFLNGIIAQTQGLVENENHATNLVDLRYNQFEQQQQRQHENEPDRVDMPGSHRRLSISSYSTNSGAHSAELASIEEPYMQTHSYPTPGQTIHSGGGHTSLSLSPVSGARHKNLPQLRTGIRARTSCSPRSSARVEPYSLDAHRHRKGSSYSYGQHSAAGSPYFHGDRVHALTTPSPVDLTSSAPSDGSMMPANWAYGNFGPEHHRQMPSHHAQHFSGPTLDAGLGIQHEHGMRGTPSLYSNASHMLQSQATHSIGHAHQHYGSNDLSEPPDLCAALREEPSDPPTEDMNETDPEKVPREQELRFEGDLYTPKWVRGHGNKREGWCGICKPGRWLVLKNSAYWYDRSFSHGISAATGNQFTQPVNTRRMDGNPDVWEGLCAHCNEWVALVSSKKKGTTWFRHAYKCHSQQKAKDNLKRRRESEEPSSHFTPERSALPTSIPGTSLHEFVPMPTTLAPNVATLTHSSEHSIHSLLPSQPWLETMDPMAPQMM